MAIKTWLTRDQFEFITRATYDVFDRIPTGTGVPKMPDGMWALGALKGFKDTGKSGTDIEVNYILCRLTRWYKTPESYIEQFAQYHEDGQDLPLDQNSIEEYARVMMDQKQFFKSSWFVQPKPKEEEQSIPQTTEPSPSHSAASNGRKSTASENSISPSQAPQEPSPEHSAKAKQTLSKQQSPSQTGTQKAREDGKEAEQKEHYFPSSTKADSPNFVPSSHHPTLSQNEGLAKKPKPSSDSASRQQPKRYQPGSKGEPDKPSTSPTYSPMRASMEDVLEETNTEE